ncbi:hypothetical protein [Dactylosporangium sp. CA-233914]|uniref:hypothetical protein n=1 Tax=Dactylosporangium sp. CA-233914 TaxID=3239934 RepID=UPI003D94DC54
MPGAHTPSICPDKESEPHPSGSLLLPPVVPLEQAALARRYALSAPQTNEVRIIIALARQLQGLSLRRYLRPFPLSILDTVYIDATIAEPPPAAGAVTRAANTLTRPIEVRLETAHEFADGEFEFRDGLGAVPQAMADRVRVWPADALDEGVNTAEEAAGRIAARFEVVAGPEAGTYDLGHGWLVQDYDWGLWVRPAGVASGVVTQVVAEVERRIAAEATPEALPYPRPLVLLGVPGGGTVPDAVLNRLDGMRRRLPIRTVARLRVEWLGERPASRVTELPDTAEPAAVTRQPEPVVPVEAAPAELTGPDDPAGAGERLRLLAGPAGLEYRSLRGMLADLGVALDNITSGNVKDLVAQWAALLLGGDASSYPDESLALLLDLIEQRIDAAGFDRAGIEAVVRATGVSAAVVSALSLRIGRVPVELATADRDGRVTLLAARLGLDPAVLLAERALLDLLEAPVSAPYSVAGPADAARVTALRLLGDPAWTAAHPPEQALGAQLRDTVRRARDLDLATDELGPFAGWLAVQGRDLDSLAGEPPEARSQLRLQWLAAEFRVRPDDIDADAAQRPWLAHGAALHLARRLRIAPQVVRRAALAAEDQPTGLDDVAERHGITAGVLWNLAIDLGLDPWALEPILAGRTRRAVADIRADLDRLTARLRVSDRIALAFLRDTGRTAADLDRATPDDLDAWAAMILGIDTAKARGYRQRLGRRYLDPVLWAADGLTNTPGDLLREAHASGVSPYWLAAASARTGKPLTNLARVARRLEVNAPQLLAVAAALRVDPDRLRGWDGLHHRLNDPQPAGNRYGAARALAEELRQSGRLRPGHEVHGNGLRRLLDELPAVTDDERDVISRAVREAREDDEPMDAGRIARSMLIQQWAGQWAPLLGQPVEDVAADLNHHFAWLSPEAVEAVAAAIGAETDLVESWRFAVRIGRLPDDIQQIAERWGIRPSALFRIAVTFDADPRHLSPILGVYRPDDQRTLAERIAEWTAWFDRWTHVRADRGLLMAALHDTGMTVEWAGTPEELRDIVDSWIATTLGQNVEAFRELERAGSLDLRAGWELMAAVTTPPPGTPLTTLSERLGVSAVWLRGAMLRFGSSTSDLDGWNAPPQPAAQLALAADLGHWPELTVAEADRLAVRGPAGWWAAVQEMTAAVRHRPAAEAPGATQDHQSTQRDSRSSAGSDTSSEPPGDRPLVAIDLALLLAYPLLPLPPGRTRSVWFEDFRRLVSHQQNGNDRATDLGALSPQVRTAFAAWRLASSSTHDQLRVRLMARLAEWLGEPWPVPGLSGAQTALVVHAAGVERRATPSGVKAYLQFVIDLFDDARIEHWVGRPPAPEPARLSRALGFDRAVGVLDTDGDLRIRNFIYKIDDAPADARSFGPYLQDTHGIFIDSLLAAYPDGGFLRLGAPDSDPARAFDGVVAHLATTPDTRGIVLYRTSTATATETGVLNALRGPAGEVLLLDPLTLLPAVLPAEGDVEVLFLPTHGPRPTGDVTPVDPRTDRSWPDPLRDWSDALGIPRLEVGQAFVDAGLTATWAGDLAAARAVVDAWQAQVLGATGVPPSESARIQLLTARLVRLAGWSDEDVAMMTRLLGVSRPWFHTAVLLTGVSPAEFLDLADRPAGNPPQNGIAGPPRRRTADGERPAAWQKAAVVALFARLGSHPSEGSGLTDSDARRLAERGPNGWHEAVEALAEGFPPPRRRAAWAGVLRLLPYIGDATAEQLEALRATLAQDGIDVGALPEPVRAAYAAAVLGDAQALAFLLPQVAEAVARLDADPVRVVHARSGTATPIERRLYLIRSGLRLPRPQGADTAADPLERVMALDEWRRGPDPDHPLPRLGRPQIADLLRQYPDSGGFVRFLDGTGRRAPGLGGLVRQLAGTGGAGIVLHRSLGAAGRPDERVLYAFDEQGTVVLVDPVSLQLAELPDGASADVLFLPTGGPATPAGRTESVDADADWAGTLAELFLPPLLLPDGVSELDGGALLVGDPAANSPLWRTAEPLTGSLSRRLVLVEQSGDDAAVVKLKVLLERLRLLGQVPVVLASRLTPALTVVSHQFKVPIVHQAPPPSGQSGLRIGNVWAVTSPGSRRPEHHEETLTGQVLQGAEALAVSAPPSPPMLAAWLDAWARGDRKGSRTMLAEHSAQLTSDAVLNWLAEMAQRAPHGVEDARVHDAVVRLDRIKQADLAYQFLAAPDAMARVEVTLSVTPEQLPGVADVLRRLGLAVGEGLVDDANAAVLESLDEILTKTEERPRTEWFPLNRIRHLDGNDKIRWADRLYELSQMEQFNAGQRAAFDELGELTLNC